MPSLGYKSRRCFLLRSGVSQAYVTRDLRGNLARMDKALKAGDVLRDGRYEIEELLRPAVGKMVYRARDRVLGCQVALDVFSNNSIMPSGLSVSA